MTDFTKTDLVSFGNFILNAQKDLKEQAKKNFRDLEMDESLKEPKKEVTFADVEAWLKK